MCVFPFDFALFPFVVKKKNHSWEYNHILNPMRPSSKVLNLGMVLGTSDTFYVPLKLKTILSLRDLQN